MSTSHMLATAQEMERIALRPHFGTLHQLRNEYMHPDCWPAHELWMTVDICRRVANEIQTLLAEKEKEEAA
jgi:hypothetical protein